MTSPEVMRAFAQWKWAGRASTREPIYLSELYPLYIGHPHTGQWYVRERSPGTRIWRAEEDGGFTLLPEETMVEAWKALLAP